MLAALSWNWVMSELKSPLVLFGFAGQFVFFLRFAVQWFESERRGKSHIPLAFWYLSLGGGVMTFIYAALKPDLVFMTAQALGILIYIRNLMLIYRRRDRIRVRRRRGLDAIPANDAPAPPADESNEDFSASAPRP
jgi:lipid-A-disaccharide synthase-like uncharacterized protein